MVENHQMSGLDSKLFFITIFVCTSLKILKFGISFNGKNASKFKLFIGLELPKIAADSIEYFAELNEEK